MRVGEKCTRVRWHFHDARIRACVCMCMYTRRAYLRREESAKPVFVVARVEVSARARRFARFRGLEKSRGDGIGASVWDEFFG